MLQERRDGRENQRLQADYLTARVAVGELPCHDSALLAQVLRALLFPFTVWPQNDETNVARAVDLLLSGIL